MSLLRKKQAAPPPFDRSLCILCGVCEALCPKQAITILGGRLELDGKKCSGCALCARACPAEAIAS